MEPLLKSNKINILIISSRSEGGAAEQYFNIMTKLGEFFKFFCALPDHPPYYDKIVNARIPTFELPYGKFGICTFFKLLKWTKANDITIVHSHGRGAGIYSRLLKLLNTKLKVVHTFHGIHFRKISLKEIVELLLRKLTNKFIFVSESERQIALDNWIVNVAKCALIENGVCIENEDYSGRDRTSALHYFDKTIPENSFVVGMLSRFDIIKNIPYAIRNLSGYLKSHDDVLLVIGGIGEDYGKIERAISEHNLVNKVILLGFVKDVKRFFSIIDVYLNTSLGEAFGFSTVEAMKYGKPVVASKVYGNTDVVDDDKTGLLFPLNKPSLLVERIETLKNDKKIYDYLAKNARESVKRRFDLNRMLNETRKMYLSLIPNLSKRRNIRVGINASSFLK